MGKKLTEKYCWNCGQRIGLNETYCGHCKLLKDRLDDSREKIRYHKNMIEKLTYRVNQCKERLEMKERGEEIEFPER